MQYYMFIGSLKQCSCKQKKWFEYARLSAHTLIFSFYLEAVTKKSVSFWPHLCQCYKVVLFCLCILEKQTGTEVSSQGKAPRLD
jgi:hypothetical protein